MKKNKKVLKVIPYLLVSQMAIPPQFLHADPTAGVGIVAGAGRGAMVTNGNTDLKVIDSSAILQKIVDQTAAVGQQNIDLVFAYTEELNRKINEFNKKHLLASGTESNLFDLAISGKRISVQSYMVAKQAYLTDKQEIQLHIDTIKGSTAAVQGTKDTVEADLGFKGLAASMPQPLKDILIALAVTPAEQYLADRDKVVNELKFTVDNYGSIQDVIGLALEPKDVKLAPKEREKIQAEIDSATSGYQQAEKVKLKQYALATRVKVDEVMNTAQQEGYRLSDPKFKEDVFTTLDDIMFTRSYLRMRYGLALGGLVIKHQTADFYKEWFTTPATIQWESEVIYSYNDKESRLRDMRAALDTASARAIDYTSWKQSDSVMWQAVSGVSSVMSFLKGTKDQERFKAAILALIIADFEEETMVTQSGGLKLLKDRFALRYISTEEKKAKYEPMYNRIDASVDQKSGIARTDESDDGFSGDSDMMSEDAQGMLGLVVGILNNKEIQMEIVREKRKYLASLATNESTTVDQSKRKKAIGNMFNKKP